MLSKRPDGCGKYPEASVPKKVSKPPSTNSEHQRWCALTHTIIKIKMVGLTVIHQILIQTMSKTIVLKMMKVPNPPLAALTRTLRICPLKSVYPVVNLPQ